MRPVAAIGFIALAFGLASYQVLGEWNAFNVVNLAAGAVGVALGAVAALQAAGKLDQVVVVGFDGQPEAKQAIRDGKLFDTPVQFPDRMAVESVKSIMKYFEGEEVDDTLLIPTEAYRSEDAEKDPTLR